MPLVWKLARGLANLFRSESESIGSGDSWVRWELWHHLHQLYHVRVLRVSEVEGTLVVSATLKRRDEL